MESICQGGDSQKTIQKIKCTQNWNSVPVCQVSLHAIRRVIWRSKYILKSQLPLCTSHAMRRVTTFANAVNQTLTAFRDKFAQVPLLKSTRSIRHCGYSMQRLFYLFIVITTWQNNTLKVHFGHTSVWPNVINSITTYNWPKKKECWPQESYYWHSQNPPHLIFPTIATLTRKGGLVGDDAFAVIWSDEHFLYKEVNIPKQNNCSFILIKHVYSFIQTNKQL